MGSYSLPAHLLLLLTTLLYLTRWLDMFSKQGSFGWEGKHLCYFKSPFLRLIPDLGFCSQDFWILLLLRPTAQQKSLHKKRQGQSTCLFITRWAKSVRGICWVTMVKQRVICSSYESLVVLFPANEWKPAEQGHCWHISSWCTREGYNRMDAQMG